MTEKRFTLDEWDIWDYADTMLVILQNGEFVSNADVCELLNNLIEENEQLKSEIKELEEDYNYLEKRFKPPYIRDRKVILEDIYECERRGLPTDELYEELRLSYTKPSFFERIFRRRF